MKSFAALTRPPSINGPGSTVPPAIFSIINVLYKQLVSFDFTKRLSDLEQARKYIDITLNNLGNSRKQAKELERKRRLRQRKQEIAKRKQERLTNYLRLRLSQND